MDYRWLLIGVCVMFFGLSFFHFRRAYRRMR